MSTIDLSNNVNLKDLSAAFNSFTELDLNNNVNLEFLTIAASFMPSIDLSANILLEIFNCDDNDFTSLNLQNNTQLRVLSCRWNFLSTIYLSEGVNNLERINANYNGITEMDLSNSPNLIEFDFSLTPITYINVKNGNNEILDLIPPFKGYKSLEFICVDDSDSEIWIPFTNNPPSNPTITEDCSLLGVADNTLQNKIRLYPNPTSGMLYIETLEKITNITVYNLLGQVVLDDINNNASQNTIDLSGVAKGMYMVQITTNTLEQVLKVIKE